MSVKISPKYQVVIPEDVRKTLGIQAGSKVEVIAKGRVAYLVPVEDDEVLRDLLAGNLDQKGLRTKKDRKL
jgi:AbrB family looped-hinge helix DNA binding protein